MSSISRTNPVHHIELSIDSKRVSLAPGDAIGVLVRNPGSLVDVVIEATGLKRDEVVTINHRTTRLDMVLAEDCDLTIPSNKFIEMWSQVALSADLTAIANLEHSEKKHF